MMVMVEVIGRSNDFWEIFGRSLEIFKEQGRN